MVVSVGMVYDFYGFYLGYFEESKYKYFKIRIIYIVVGIIRIVNLLIRIYELKNVVFLKGIVLFVCLKWNFF